MRKSTRLAALLMLVALVLLQLSSLVPRAQARAGRAGDLAAQGREAAPLVTPPAPAASVSVFLPSDRSSSADSPHGPSPSGAGKHRSLPPWHLPAKVHWQVRMVPALTPTAELSRGYMKAYHAGRAQLLPSIDSLQDPDREAGEAGEAVLPEFPSKLTHRGSRGREKLAGWARPVRDATWLARAPLCGSRAHVALAFTEDTHITSTAGSSEVEVYDAHGNATRIQGLHLPMLGSPSRHMHALVPSAAVSSITLFEAEAFAGRAHAVPMLGGACRLEASLAQRIRSIRVDLQSESIRLIFSSAAIARVVHGEGDAPSLSSRPYVRDVHGEDSALTLGRADLGLELRGEPDLASPNHTAPPNAICFGLHVAGVVLFAHPAFHGPALVLLRSLAPADDTPRSDTNFAAAAAPSPTTGVASSQKTKLDAESCVSLPGAFHSLRVVGSSHALLLPQHGRPLVVRGSRPFLMSILETHAHLQAVPAPDRDALAQPTTLPRARGVAALGTIEVCMGSAVSAVELYSLPRWLGTSETITAAKSCAPLQRARSVGAPQVGDSRRSRTSSALRAAGLSSVRLHLTRDSVELGGPPRMALDANASASTPAVMSADRPQLSPSNLAFTHVTLGSQIEMVVLYRGAEYTGARLVLRNDGSQPCTKSIPSSWRGDVGSLAIVRDCTATLGVLCERPRPSRNVLDAEVPEILEYSLPAQGKVLPFRTPSQPPRGFPEQLTSGRHGSFHAYNPSILVQGDGSVTLVARYSNYNFCTRKRKFEDNLAEANGALINYVVRSTLNVSTWRVIPGSFEVWDALHSRFPVLQGRTISGLEDPRAIRLDNETLIFLSAWESEDIQWQHMLRVQGAQAVDRRMDISQHHMPPLRPWLRQFALSSDERVREKNWCASNVSPFMWRGTLYVEYSLEPRLVLAVDMNTGLCAPILPLTTSPAVRAWLDKLGPVSGSTPAVELPGHGLFLALGHVKLFKKKGPKTATSAMMYKHFWYAFAAMPPFAVLGASLPFTLPSQLSSPPSIQFATGLVYRPHTHELIASYGELDCHTTLASFPLSATLDSTLGRRKPGPPAPLLSTLLVLDSDEVPGDGAVEADSQGRSTLERLEYLLSALGNASSADSQTVPAQRGDPRGMVMLTKRCGLAPRSRRMLKELRFAHGCLACTWSAVAHRKAGESSAQWAERLYEHIRCHLSSRSPSRVQTLEKLAERLGGAFQLSPGLQGDLCTVVCAEAEEPALCRCAAEPDDRDYPVESLSASAARHLGSTRYGVVIYGATKRLPLGVHREEERAHADESSAVSNSALGFPVACLARASSPGSVLMAIAPTTSGVLGLPERQAGASPKLETDSDAKSLLLLADVVLARNAAHARELALSGAPAMSESLGWEAVHALLAERALAAAVESGEVQTRNPLCDMLPWHLLP